MKKTIFVLLMGLQCIAPCLAPSAHQIAGSVATETVKASGEIAITARDQSVSLIPAVSSSTSTALPIGKQAQVRKNLHLRGYTSGSDHLDGLIITSAADNRLDPVLLYLVMHRESAFNPRAVSRRGACGLMQLIPA